MPHFSGRLKAQELGDPERPWAECDWNACTDRLAQALRLHSSGGKQVTLVIHDWGSVWGFYLQSVYPQLVKAIVAMDVGPWAMGPKWRNVPSMLFIGFIYQYWLAAAHIVGRSSSSQFGVVLADWMARSFARLAKKSLGDKASITDTVTSDACYPYYYIHRNFLRELLGLSMKGTVNGFQTPPHTNDRNEVTGGAAATNTRRQHTPAVPCLFFYGAKKRFKFHDSGWEKHLQKRADCEVVAVPAGHWLQTECPGIVNKKMEQWLAATLPNISATEMTLTMVAAL